MLTLKVMVSPGLAPMKPHLGRLFGPWSFDHSKPLAFVTALCSAAPAPQAATTGVAQEPREKQAATLLEARLALWVPLTDVALVRLALIVAGDHGRRQVVWRADARQLRPCEGPAPQALCRGEAGISKWISSLRC